MSEALVQAVSGCIGGVVSSFLLFPLGWSSPALELCINPTPSCISSLADDD